MKISFISGNLCDGGAQRVISVVASELAERGHDVNIFVFARNEKEYSVSSKVKITAISDNFEDYSKISLFKRIIHIRRFLKKFKPDVAVGFLEGGYGLYLASFGLKVKKVASARIDPKILWKQKGIRAIINRKWFESADAVVLQTNSQMKNVPNKVKERSTVIANPVSKRALNECMQDYSEKAKSIIMIGRLEKQKNYPMMLDAIQKVKQEIPGVTLNIFGKGTCGNELKALAISKGLDDSVCFKGWTQNAIGDYLNHDIFVLSSNYEGMPNSLMEAMAVGLPCVSTDCETGPADLITDRENGFLVPVGDSETMAKTLIEVLKMDCSDRVKLGCAAHSTMKDKFGVERITDKWEMLLNGLLEES